MTENFPRNELEFDRRFDHEQACINYLFQLRWPQGFICSECGHTHYWSSLRGLYICQRCEKQHSVTAGTIFHSTKKPLKLWFKALWWFSTRKSGINATTLKDLLGLGSYQTAWRWLQKLRTCTIFPQRAPLSGNVEVDEFYLGGESHGKRGRGAPHKHKVAIAVERKGRRLGRLRIQVIDNCSAQQLLPFVKNTIASNSGVITDGWKGYQGLDQSGYRHQALRSCQAADKNSVLPGVHLVISLIKRFLCGTFQGRFDGAYLQRYLDEYVFRFNRRTCRSVGKRFWRIAQRAASSPPITNIALKLTPS